MLKKNPLFKAIASIRQYITQGIIHLLSNIIARADVKSYIMRNGINSSSGIKHIYIYTLNPS